MEPAPLLERARGVVGEARAHLDAGAAVEPAAARVLRRQQIAGGLDVLDREALEQRRPSESIAEQALDRSIVGVAARDRLLEDGGIRGNAHHALIAHLGREHPRAQLVAVDVVEPHALAEPEQLTDAHFAHRTPSWARYTRRPSGSSSRATRWPHEVFSGGWSNTTPRCASAR